MAKENFSDWTKEELIKEIDKVLATRKLGYESRPEFIKESVRKRLEELKPLAR